MADLALLPTAADLDAGIGLDLFDGDLALDDSLRSAVIVSLFTDREADGADRRGWWGDALTPGQDRIGSLLWQLQRRNESPALLTDAKRHTEAALRWLIDDGAARAVTATASFPARGRLDIQVEIERPNGTRELIRFADIWAASLSPYQNRVVSERLLALQQLAADWTYIAQVLYPQVHA